ncbi:hypothetical protein QF028_000193 [Neobacillus sp. B4I6]|uniref:hypothetical protein n=1 Tax=Neobacillus sp. B4I6 TaxID=3373925 RepID=UPI003D1BE185
MRERKSALAIISQGLSAVWAGLLEKERERLLASNGFGGVSIGYGQWCLSRYMRAKLHML